MNSQQEYTLAGFGIRRQHRSAQELSPERHLFADATAVQRGNCGHLADRRCAARKQVPVPQPSLHQSRDWTEESEGNHAAVAEAYKAWWEKAKLLTPEKAKAVDPLKETGLVWH